MVPPGNEIVTKFKDQVVGKTILITGPSDGGIGGQTAIFLAAENPKLLLLAGRDKTKIQPVIDEIAKLHPAVQVGFVALDLGSQGSVREAAREISVQIGQLDILINNAGIMAVKKKTLTVNGIESQFAVNHIGHFLLTNLLMSKMIAAGKGARVINVSSGGHMSGGIRDDYNFEKEEYNPWLAYAQSKTANILLSSALARHLQVKGVLAFAVNPGLILETKLQTEVTQEMFADGHAIAMKALNGEPFTVNMVPKTLAEGTTTILIAALDPSLSDNSGAYLSDGVIDPAGVRPHAIGEERENQLWALSEKLVEEKFTY